MRTNLSKYILTIVFVIAAYVFFKMNLSFKIPILVAGFATPLVLRDSVSNFKDGMLLVLLFAGTFGLIIQVAHPDSEATKGMVFLMYGLISLVLYLVGWCAGILVKKISGYKDN